VTRRDFARPRRPRTGARPEGERVRRQISPERRGPGGRFGFVPKVFSSPEFQSLLASLVLFTYISSLFVPSSASLTFVGEGHKDLNGPQWQWTSNGSTQPPLDPANLPAGYLRHLNSGLIDKEDTPRPLRSDLTALDGKDSLSPESTSAEGALCDKEFDREARQLVHRATEADHTGSEGAAADPMYSDEKAESAVPEKVFIFPEGLLRERDIPRGLADNPATVPDVSLGIEPTLPFGPDLLVPGNGVPEEAADLAGQGILYFTFMPSNPSLSMALVFLALGVAGRQNKKGADNPMGLLLGL